MKINCLIVDDEPLALDLLETHIEAVNDLQLVGRCENALDAMKMLRAHSVDLIFLDIQMPTLTGIDFIKSLSRKPKIIMTTAYKEYAFDAFQLDVVDYLLKPITFGRFLKAINKVLHQNYFPVQKEAAAPVFEEAFIYLKADKKSVKVILKDILYIESCRDYVRVYTEEASILAHHRISALEEKLPESLFLRIHRSFIVSKNKVSAFTPSSVELGGKVLSIGRLYKEQVMEFLQEKLV